MTRTINCLICGKKAKIKFPQTVKYCDGCAVKEKERLEKHMPYVTESGTVTPLPLLNRPVKEHITALKDSAIQAMNVKRTYIDGTTDKPKDKQGKYQPHLVCSSLTEAVARVREYGVLKYNGENGWKQQAMMDYMDAVGRHYDACRNDPFARDEESGLLHICQIATDAMFIIQMLTEAGVDIAVMKEPTK